MTAMRPTPPTRPTPPIRTNLLFLAGLLTALLGVGACGQAPDAAAPSAAAGHDAAAAGAAAAKGAAKDVEIREDPVKTGIETGDAGLAAKVRQRLAGDPHLGSLPVEVDAESGRATLWGHVPSAADRAAVEELARRTPGVSSVLDHIKIDGAGQPPA